VIIANMNVDVSGLSLPDDVHVVKLYTLQHPNPLNSVRNYAQRTETLFQLEDIKLCVRCGVEDVMRDVVNVKASNIAKARFFFPRSMFSIEFGQYIIGNPQLQAPSSKKVRGDHDSYWIWNPKWEIDDIVLLNKAFFGQFYPRIYFDEDGNFNFRLSDGTLAGGIIIPLIRDNRPATIRYDWRNQMITIEFLMEKYKCVLGSNGKEGFTMLAI